MREPSPEAHFPFSHSISLSLRRCFWVSGNVKSNTTSPPNTYEIFLPLARSLSFSALLAFFALIFSLLRLRGHGLASYCAAKTPETDLFPSRSLARSIQLLFYYAPLPLPGALASLFPPQFFIQATLTMLAVSPSQRSII